MATVEDVRRLASSFPRAYEALVRDRVKFRVGSIVFVSFSTDEKRMGFAFPKEERAGLVANRPEVFQLPNARDMRFNWVVARVSELDPDEMRELVTDAWQMVVPKFVARGYFEGQ